MPGFACQLIMSASLAGSDWHNLQVLLLMRHLEFKFKTTGSLTCALIRIIQ